MLSVEVLKSMKTLFSDFRKSTKNLRIKLTGCPVILKSVDCFISSLFLHHQHLNGLPLDIFLSNGSVCRKKGHHRPGVDLHACRCVDQKFFSNRRMFLKNLLTTEKVLFHLGIPQKGRISQ